MKTLDPDVLIAFIGKEFDCQKIQGACCYGGKEKDDTNDEVMTVSPNSSKLKDGMGTTRKPCGTCWNCGKVGHYSNKCLKPKVKKAKESPKKPEKPKGSAKTAVEKESDSKSNGTWVAVDSDNESTTSLWDDIPDTDDKWFSDNDFNVNDIGEKGSSHCNLSDKLFVAIEPSKCGEYSYV